jgi:predicted nucleotidyltransferase
MMTKTLRDLLAHAETWPREDQDEPAEYAREIEARRSGLYRMSDDERAAVNQGLAEADQGKFISDDVIAKEAPIFAEQHGLVLKTVALKEPLKTALEPYADKIKAAFVYGSVAKETDNARSDIDIMVIGDGLNYSDLYTALQDVEDRVRRKINPMFLSLDEWRRRSAKDGSFTKKLGAHPKLFILGSERDLHA